MAKKSNKSSRAKLKVASLLGLAILATGFLYFPFFTENKKNECANSISCIEDLSGAYQNETESIFLDQKILTPSYLANLSFENKVLGETTLGPKHIFVDLTNQRLYAYEGQNLVFDFPISSGKWALTPTGDFRIWIKLRYTRMEGGEGNDYYNLPNVPYTMFFYNENVPKARGFALHGAYWHNNFGYPMSHGCVNIRPDDAGKLFSWATPVSEGSTTYATSENPGTLVTIFGDTRSF